MVQVDSSAIKNKADIQKYFIGSILSGGGSDPADNRPETRLKFVDEFQAQALQTRLKIPLLYGIDAVHGHNNIDGAVIFPHDIGMEPHIIPDSQRRQRASRPRKSPAPVFIGRSGRAWRCRRTSAGDALTKVSATIPRWFRPWVRHKCAGCRSRLPTVLSSWLVQNIFSPMAAPRTALIREMPSATKPLCENFFFHLTLPQ